MPDAEKSRPASRHPRVGAARDRRGRGLRGALAWPRIPAMTPRGAAFDALVLEAWKRIEDRYGSPLEHIELAVEMVPPSDPAPWETRIALGRVFPAEGSLPARVVLYRRPVETRAAHEESVAFVVIQVLAEHLATLLGTDPDDLI